MDLIVASEGDFWLFSDIVAFVSLLDSKLLITLDSGSWFIGGLTVHQWIQRGLMMGPAHNEVSNPKTPEDLDTVVLADRFISICASPEIEQEPSPPMEWKFRGREG